MAKSLKKIIYGDIIGDASSSFYEKLKNLEEKYSDFLTENKIDFDGTYLFKINDYDVLFKILNQSVLESSLGKEMEIAFSESFSKLFKKG